MIRMLFLSISILCAISSYISDNEKESRLAIMTIRKERLFEKLYSINNDSILSIYALSIVAPEISRYSSFEDAIQKRALVLLYVHNNICNFSVGMFQMKPNFVEQLEKEILNSPDLHNKYGNLLINNSDEIEIKIERLRRLSDIDWQVRYLNLFVCIALERIRQWDKELSSDQILKYLATLYNGGINLSKNEVDQLLKLTQFPHLSRNQYNYANIALEFFYVLQHSVLR